MAKGRRKPGGTKGTVSKRARWGKQWLSGPRRTAPVSLFSGLQGNKKKKRRRG